MQNRVHRGVRRWTADEIEILRSRYPSEGGVALSPVLNRSPACINDRANRLGLRVAKRADPSNKIKETHATIRARSPLIPPHVRAREEFSRDWYMAQQKAFSEAMELNPTERPS